MSDTEVKYPDDMDTPPLREKEKSTVSIRVVVVDDQESTVKYLSELLSMEDDIVVVGKGYNGQQAVDLTVEHHPDVVLLDLQMPVMSGIDALTHLRERAPETKVLILTSHDEDKYLFPAIKRGASGYLLRKAKIDEVADCIRRVARGEIAISSSLWERVLEEFERMASLPKDTLRLSQLLTRQEMNVLTRIAAGHTNQWIADEFVLTLQVVKFHVTNILKKLEVNSRKDAATIAIRSGLVDDRTQK